MPTPGIATVAVAGAVLDPFLASVAGALGGTLGETTGYLAGYGSRSLAATRLTATAERIKPWLERYGVVAIALFAAFPNPFFDAAGIAAGAVGFPIWKFLLAILVGMSIKCLAFAYLGQSILGGPLGF